jgi:hypothetical protein
MSSLAPNLFVVARPQGPAPGGLRPSGSARPDRIDVLDLQSGLCGNTACRRDERRQLGSHRTPRCGEQDSNRRSPLPNGSPFAAKGNVVEVKRDSLVSVVSLTGDRGFESCSLPPASLLRNLTSLWGLPQSTSAIRDKRRLKERQARRLGRVDRADAGLVQAGRPRAGGFYQYYKMRVEDSAIRRRFRPAPLSARFGSLARMLNGLEMTDHAARGGPERPVITESRRRSSLQLAGTVCQPVLHCVT